MSFDAIVHAHNLSVTSPWKYLLASALSISNVSFSTCSLQASFFEPSTFAFITLTLPDGITSSQFTLTGLSFDSCEGTRMQISCTDGTTFLPDADLSGTLDSYSSTLEPLYQVVESGRYFGEGSSYVSLLHFRFPPSNASLTQGYTAQSQYSASETWGADVSSCGWVDVPCQRVGTSYGHISTSSDGSITLLYGTYTHSAETEMTTFTESVTLTISGNTSNPTVKSLTSFASLSVTAMFNVTAGTFTLSHITFQFTESSFYHNIVTASSGTVSLTSLIVTPSTCVTLTKPL